MFFPESLHVGVGEFDVVVGNGRGIFHGVGDMACGCTVVVDSFGIEFVGCEEAEDKAVELLAKERVFDVAFLLAPSLAELFADFGGEAVFCGRRHCVEHHLA